MIKQKTGRVSIKENGECRRREEGALKEIISTIAPESKGKEGKWNDERKGETRGQKVGMDQLLSTRGAEKNPRKRSTNRGKGRIAGHNLSETVSTELPLKRRPPNGGGNREGGAQNIRSGKMRPH